MGRLCVFDSCSTNFCLIKPRDIKLHRFPSDPDFKSKWEEWVRKVGGPDLTEFAATKSSHTLCSKHFKPSDYMRKRLCFQALPSIPPEAPAEPPPPVTISDVRSLSEPWLENSATESKVHVKSFPLTRTKTQPTGVLIPIKCAHLPQRLSVQTLIGPINNVIIPNHPSPLRLQSSVGEPVKNTCDTIPTYSLTLLGGQTNFGSEPRSEGQGTSTTVTYFSPQLRYSRNGSATPDSNAKTPEKQAKRRRHVGGIQPSEFECRRKAQSSLETASSEVAKAKRKLKLMQLKYVRSIRKIKTLMDMINQYKEGKGPVDEEVVRVKVCSNCRKVDLCR